MQKPHQPTGVAYGLTEPDRLRIALAVVFFQQGVFREAMAFVRGRDGEDEEEGESGPRDKGEQIRVGQRVDVVNL